MIVFIITYKCGSTVAIASISAPTEDAAVICFLDQHPGAGHILGIRHI